MDVLPAQWKPSTGKLVVQLGSETLFDNIQAHI